MAPMTIKARRVRRSVAPSLALSVVSIIELPAGFTVFALELLGLSVGPLQSAPDGSSASRQTESQADHRQPWRGIQPAVQPLAAQQTEQDTERELEPNRPVCAETFPALLHECLKGGGFDYHTGRPSVNATPRSSTPVSV
jgi:hypothetical protein